MPLRYWFLSVADQHGRAYWRAPGGGALRHCLLTEAAPHDSSMNLHWKANTVSLPSLLQLIASNLMGQGWTS